MIVVDVETTGTDSRKHSIVSIGAVDFKEPCRQFYAECRVWPGAEITDKALEINGFSRDQVTDLRKQPLEDAVMQFLEWAHYAQDITIAGENPRFDLDFIRASADRYRIKVPFSYRTIDVHSVSYAHHIKSNRNPPVKDRASNLDFDTTLLYVGLPPEPKPHNALMGAKCEAEALARLLYGKKLVTDFLGYAIPSHC